VAKAGGFRTVILTAKHHDGFCLWPTATTGHSVAHSPWREGRGDLVREFVDAMRAAGLGAGLYLSPWDRNASCYGDSPAYNDFYCAQLTELLSHYGPLVEVWFDGACAEGPNGRRQAYDWARYFALVRRLQPGAVTFGDGGTDVRWVGNERGIAGESCWATIDPHRCRFPGDSGIDTGNDAVAKGNLRHWLETGEPPDGAAPRVWRPAECDVSIRPGWFYHPQEDGQVRSVADLLTLHDCSVGRNSLLLLNVPPMPDGRMHATDAERLAAFRQANERRFARDLALQADLAAPAGLAGHEADCIRDADPDRFWMPADGAQDAVIELNWPQPLTARAMLLELAEPVAWGQRISRFRLEARESRQDPWRPVAEGGTVGRRRLLAVTPGRWSGIRLQVEALATVMLSRLALHAEETP
jgi:alpha-L-fucosidase